MVPHYIFDCNSFRALKSGPRCLLFEIIRRFNGSNNGSIGLGVREACKALAMTDKGTMSKYFVILQQHGFIAETRPGGFNMKDPQGRRASEWRLTWMPYATTGATKDFLKWEAR